jgi:hypothetical protein
VGFLGQQPDRQVPPALDGPAVRLVPADRDPEQRRLAGPVRPDQSDPVADGDRRVDVVEDDE